VTRDGGIMAASNLGPIEGGGPKQGGHCKWRWGKKLIKGKASTSSVNVTTVGYAALTKQSSWVENDIMCGGGWG